MEARNQEWAGPQLSSDKLAPERRSPNATDQAQMDFREASRAQVWASLQLCPQSLLLSRPQGLHAAPHSTSRLGLGTGLARTLDVGDTGSCTLSALEVCFTMAFSADLLPDRPTQDHQPCPPHLPALGLCTNHLLALSCHEIHQGYCCLQPSETGSVSLTAVPSVVSDTAVCMSE